MRVSIKGFTTQQQKAMDAEYAAAEQDVQAHPERQAVLVGAESVTELKRGYASFLVEPYYFMQEVRTATK
jgi:hypothetical protein